ACGYTGYAGRTVVSEIFELTEDIFRAIDVGESEAKLYEIASREGMQSLSENAIEKIIEGETTLEEIKREALV
ncbi:type II secretion system protein GspE, partial [Treponema socranskii]